MADVECRVASVNMPLLSRAATCAARALRVVSLSLESQRMRRGHTPRTGARARWLSASEGPCAVW